MSQRGRDVVLYVNIGTDVSPNWVVGGARQTGLTVNATRSAQQVGHKDSETAISIPGSVERTMSVQGLIVPTDLGTLSLETALNTGQPVLVREYESGDEKRESLVNITRFDKDYPLEGFATYSIEMQPIDVPFPV